MDEQIEQTCQNIKNMETQSKQLDSEFQELREQSRALKQKIKQLKESVAKELPRAKYVWSRGDNASKDEDWRGWWMYRLSVWLTEIVCI